MTFRYGLNWYIECTGSFYAKYTFDFVNMDFGFVYCAIYGELSSVKHIYSIHYL